MESISMLQLFQNPLASAELGANPFATQLGTGQAPSVPGEFTDLLGLVADMELADSQDLMGNEALAGEFAAIDDRETLELKRQTNAAALDMMNVELMALNGESIGRLPATAVEIAPGFESAIKLPTNAAAPSLAADFLLGQTAAPSPNAMNRSTEGVSGESLQAWSLALARDEIKSVKLEPGVEAVAKGGDGVTPRELSRPQLGTEAVPAKGESATFATAFVQQAPESEPVRKESALNRDAISAKPERAAAKAEVVTEKAVVRAEKPERESMSGGDFLLDKSVDHQVASADFRSSFGAMAAGYGSQPALARGAELGETHDKRIQPQALEFVADKVNELKAQGGGRLKVELQAEGMGTIEITVGMRAGQMHVQLSAENADTLRALEGSRGALSERLSSIGESRLDIGERTSFSSARTSIANATRESMPTDGFVSAHRHEAAPVSVDKPTLGHDFMKTSIETASKHDGGGIELPKRESTSLSDRQWNQDHQNSDTNRGRGFERQADAQTGEGRDRAFEQWERSFRERRTA